MIKQAALLTILLVSSQAFACMTDPWHFILNNPKQKMDNADIVFYGKIIEFNDLLSTAQIVSFEVLKTYKGPELKNVRITNGLESSCSRPFFEKGSLYYVYAKLDESTGKYVMPGGATFVPQRVADENNFEPNHTHNDGLQRTPASGLR